MFHHTDLQFNQPLAPRNATKFIILHHSGSSSLSVEELHNLHQKKGWAGIGYHYFIAKDGDVYEGRPRETVGEHTPGQNQESVGICFEGNFDTEELTKQQENAAIKLLTTLSIAYSDAELRQHRDFAQNKTCPGIKFPFEHLLQSVATTISNIGFSTAISKQNYKTNPYTIFDFQSLIRSIRNGGKAKNDLACYETYYGPVTEDMSIEDMSFHKNYLTCFDIETELKGLSLRTDPFSMEFHERLKGKEEPTCLNPPPSPADFDLLQRLLYGTFSCDYSFSPSDRPDTYELTLLASSSDGERHTEIKVHTLYPTMITAMKKFMNILVEENIVMEAAIATALLPGDRPEIVEAAVEIEQKRDQRKQLFQERARQFLQDLEGQTT
jgi:hypothetical protein